MKIYAKPGRHAVATYEKAVEQALRAGYPVSIMEMPLPTHDTGWHRIENDAVEYYQKQGYILRAQVKLVVEVVQ